MFNIKGRIGYTLMRKQESDVLIESKAYLNFNVLFENLFRNFCCYLVVFASRLYAVSTWTEVELLTELCVLPVVDGLTGRRWTTMIA